MIQKDIDFLITIVQQQQKLQERDRPTNDCFEIEHVLLKKKVRSNVVITTSS